MRILLAAPDRDLLECYQKLLETDFGETVTAFDGAQVLSLIAAEQFDAAILDRDIPGVGFDLLVERAVRGKVPVVTLTNGGENDGGFESEANRTAVLPYPFTPEEIEARIRSVTLQEEPEKEGKEQGDEE